MNIIWFSGILILSANISAETEQMILKKNIHESKVRDTVMIRTVSRALLCARRAHILTSTKEMNYAADDHMVRTISFSSARSSSGM